MTVWPWPVPPLTAQKYFQYIFIRIIEGLLVSFDQNPVKYKYQPALRYFSLFSKKNDVIETSKLLKTFLLKE